MIDTLKTRLLPTPEPAQADNRRYSKEDFATWRRVALAENSARMSAAHENASGCDCFQRLCGPGVCDIANDESPKE